MCYKSITIFEAEVRIVTTNQIKSDSQQYHWNLYLINNVQDIAIYLGLEEKA